MSGHYTLEVSSPGINRPLRRPEHFQKVLGKRVKDKNGQEKFEPEKSLLMAIPRPASSALLSTRG